MTADQDISEPLPKKLKPNELDLKLFKCDEILNLRSREKVLFVKGKFDKSQDDSILIFEKSSFSEDVNNLQLSVENDHLETKTIMSNDIYKTLNVIGMSSLNSIKLTIINPATEKHIQKYSKPKYHFLTETPSIFNDISKPFIESNKFSLTWIENLLTKKAEEDRVLIQNDETQHGFVLALDYKWSGLLLDDLHCLAIVSDSNLQSLRNLNAEHLPLLKEIMEKSKIVISRKYDVPISQLRLYFHYPPSFYHLHIHISHINNDSAGALIDRAHLLSTVIQNIELKNDYYQKTELNVSVSENDPLYQVYKSNKCFE